MPVPVPGPVATNFIPASLAEAPINVKLELPTSTIIYSVDATSEKIVKGVSLPTSAALVPTFSLATGAAKPSAFVHVTGLV